MIGSMTRLVCVVAFASAALAQNIYIAHPAAKADVEAGSPIEVEVVRPPSLTGEESVAVAIGIAHCDSESHCPNVGDELGEILHQGLYSPKLYNRYGDPYQNFTLVIPSGYKGWVQLGVAHFFLLAAGPSAHIEFATTPLHVHPVSSS